MNACYIFIFASQTQESLTLVSNEPVQFESVGDAKTQGFWQEGGCCSQCSVSGGTDCGRILEHDECGARVPLLVRVVPRVQRVPLQITCFFLSLRTATTLVALRGLRFTPWLSKSRVPHTYPQVLHRTHVAPHPASCLRFSKSHLPPHLSGCFACGSKQCSSEFGSTMDPTF